MKDFKWAWAKPLGNSTLTITHSFGQDAKNQCKFILHKRHSESDEAGSIFWHKNWEPTRGILGSRAPFWWSVHLHQSIAYIPVTTHTSGLYRIREPWSTSEEDQVMAWGRGNGQDFWVARKWDRGKTRAERGLGEERDREREREVGLPQSGPSQEKAGFNHCLEKWATLSESLSPLCMIGWKFPALSKKRMESTLKRAK